MIAREVQLLLIALQFLTRLPLGARETLPTDWLARSAKYMPLVGALVGLAAGCVMALAALIIPAPLTTVIGLLTAVALTGALHEDGLVDTFDALGSGAGPQRSLEIMKDSRIGTFGAIALIAVLALKGAALLPLDQGSAARVLIAGHAGARLAAVLTLALLPHAGGAAKVSGKESAMTGREIGATLVFGLVPGFLALPIVTFGIAAFFAFAAAALMAHAAWRRIGGYTGDVLGAVEQVFETVFFIFAAAVIAGPG